MTVFPLRPPVNAACVDGLAPAQGRVVVTGVLVLHVAMVAWALQDAPVERAEAALPAAMQVEFVAAPEPAPAPAPAPVPTSAHVRPPVPAVQPPPVRPIAPVALAPAPAEPADRMLAAAPSPDAPEASAPTLPLSMPAAATPAAALPVPGPAAAPAPAAPPAPPPAPRELPAAAVQYLVPPAPSYPRLSRRLRESGLVVVRVLVGADGAPQQVLLAQSSGFARLDEAALAGVRLARFLPYREAGQPVAGWARIPIPFELEP